MGVDSLALGWVAFGFGLGVDLLGLCLCRGGVAAREAFDLPMPWDEEIHPMEKVEGCRMSTSEAMGVVSEETLVRLLTPKVPPFSLPPLTLPLSPELTFLLPLCVRVGM